MCNTVSKGFWDGGSLVLVHPGTRLGRWPCATIAGDESSATISVTKCEKDGEVYAERVPESKRGFKHLTDVRIWSFLKMATHCFTSHCSLVVTYLTADITG